MENAKNVRWIIPFKKFSMERVNLCTCIDTCNLQYIYRDHQKAEDNW